MTAEELYNEYNKRENHLNASLKVCEQFLEYYPTLVNDPKLVDYYHNFLWNMFFG